MITPNTPVGGTPYCPYGASVISIFLGTLIYSYINSKVLLEF